MADALGVCLMYHEVPEQAIDAGYFAVPRTSFAEHLDALARCALAGRTMEAWLETATLGVSDAPGLAITFDDGHFSHYQAAFPELLARGMAATFFVITDRVGTVGYASWAQLREMADAGMSIQSHTASHPFLSELHPTAAAAELRRSRDAIEQTLGRPVTSLALPGGDSVRGWSPDEYAAQGFRWVATSRWGANQPGLSAPAFVRRFTIRRETTLPRFERICSGDASAWSWEGLRLGALSRLRGALGPSRYARLRRHALRVVRRAP